MKMYANVGAHGCVYDVCACVGVWVGGCSRCKGGAVVFSLSPPAGLLEGLQPRSLIWEAVTRSLSHSLQRPLKMYV